MYENKGPEFLNKYIKKREEYSKEHYLERGREFIFAFEVICSIAFIFCSTYLVLLGHASFFTALLPVIIGFVLAHERPNLLIMPTYKPAVITIGFINHYNHFKHAL